MLPVAQDPLENKDQLDYRVYQATVALLALSAAKETGVTQELEECRGLRVKTDLVG